MLADRIIPIISYTEEVSASFSSEKKNIDEPIAKREKLQSPDINSATPVNALSALGSYDSDSTSESDD